MFQQPIRTPSLVCLTMASCAVLWSTGAVLAHSGEEQRAKPVADGDRALITLNVPLDSIVFVDGRRTYNSGMTRRFLTPPLAPENKYFYDVKVSWIEGNRARVAERRLSFKAGQRVEWDMTRPNWTQYQQDLYVDPAAPAPWRTDYYHDPLNAPNYPNRGYTYPGIQLYPR